jgi:hypothetical protein
MQTPLVELNNIRKVEMTSETYQNNACHFTEALATHGTITSSRAIDGNNLPGSIEFSDYWLSNTGISQVEAADKYKYYPGPLIGIDGALKIELTSMTFNNNYRYSN